ncbi:MAG: BrnT family toxin [Chloroflexi bacterium]|nr:BrnT family toxin [Chloroflexota bacterium]
MKFEWGERKNDENIRKHRIDFADVPSVFDGPMLIDLDERIEYGETRFAGIGLLRNTIVVVVFIERGPDTIRLISARKALKHERKRFEQEIPH